MVIQGRNRVTAGVRCDRLAGYACVAGEVVREDVVEARAPYLVVSEECMAANRAGGWVQRDLRKVILRIGFSVSIDRSMCTVTLNPLSERAEAVGSPYEGVIFFPRDAVRNSLGFVEVASNNRW